MNSFFFSQMAWKDLNVVLAVAIFFIFLQCCRGFGPVHKRLFYTAECRGDYAPHFDDYINRVDTICRECSEMYPKMRDFIATNCSSECFRNQVFQDCMSATMQLHQLTEIHNMIGELSGRK